MITSDELYDDFLENCMNVEDCSKCECNCNRPSDVLGCALMFGYYKGRTEAVDGFANWLVEQGILGNRCICDGEITDYGKIYAEKYKKHVVEGELR